MSAANGGWKTATDFSCRTSLWKILRRSVTGITEE